MQSSSTGSASGSAPEPPGGLSGPVRILTAAERVFVREGVERARMDAIASEAGMARSHLYYHFKNSEQIFDALIELRTAEMLAAKAVLMDEVSGSEPSTALEVDTLLRRAIEGVMEPYRDFLRLMVIEAIRRPELPPAMHRLVHEVLRDTFGRLGWSEPFDQKRSIDVFYLLIAPTLMAVALPSDPTGSLAKPSDIAPHLARAHAQLLFGEPGRLGRPRQ